VPNRRNGEHERVDIAARLGMNRPGVQPAPVSGTGLAAEGWPVSGDGRQAEATVLALRQAQRRHRRRHRVQVVAATLVVLLSLAALLWLILAEVQAI
jgi:hypothetical protein